MRPIVNENAPVNRQDLHVCELSQQGITSRAYQPGPYSPRESIPAAWDNYI
jgi:phenylpropionate dioxygenase-like ring-hydroxylating dioxygenase large terminal subunit